jgi:hypothetical protein
MQNQNVMVRGHRVSKCDEVEIKITEIRWELMEMGGKWWGGGENLQF